MAHSNFIKRGGKVTGIQLVEKSPKYTHGGKNITKYIAGITSKSNKDAIDRYVSDVQQWHGAGQPMQKIILNQIQKMWTDNPTVNLFLADCGCLEYEGGDTISDLLEYWVGQSDKVQQTVDDVRNDWEMVFDILGKDFPVSKLTKDKLSHVYTKIVSDKKYCCSCEIEYVGEVNAKKRIRTVGDKRKSPNTLHGYLVNIQKVINVAIKRNVIKFDILPSISNFIDNKRRSVAKVKEYISVEDYHDTYLKLDSISPDYALFYCFMRTLGVRPNECWFFDSWEDIEWDDPKEKNIPISINRTFSKNHNRDVLKSDKHRTDKVKVYLPKITQRAIIKYRNDLRNWRTKWPNLYNYRLKNRKPPEFDVANNTFHGRLFCIKQDPRQMVKDLERLYGLETPEALFTCLRASASANYYDFGGAAAENHYLQHNEQSRRKHYSDIKNSPLLNRPDRISVSGGAVLQHINELFDVGDDYYKTIDENKSYGDIQLAEMKKELGLVGVQTGADFLV